MVENLVRAVARNAPFQIVQFEKTNGRGLSARGIDGYQLFYHAIVEFPSGIAPGQREKNYWDQILTMGPNEGVLMALSQLGFKVTKGDKLIEIQ